MEGLLEKIQNIFSFIRRNRERADVALKTQEFMRIVLNAARDGNISDEERLEIGQKAIEFAQEVADIYRGKSSV